MTRASLPRASALLIVEPEPGEPAVTRDADRLLAAWRASGRTVVHLRRLSSRAAPPGRPGEVVVQAATDDPFHETGLGPLLRDRGIALLVVAGTRAGGPREAILRAAERLGYDTVLVGDEATLAREDVLAALGDRYASPRAG